MFLRTIIYALALAAAGCGYTVDSATPSQGASVVAPVIIAQPASQSVPMGLATTFAVTAAGTSPQYQWVRNGAPIPGAVGSSYQLGPVGFADSGQTFAVIISNAAGTITSEVATLTVTARAPAAGDLRFQQVDATSTVNGYGIGVSVVTTQLIGLQAQTYASTIGTSLWAGASQSCVVASSSHEAYCVWDYAAVPLAVTGVLSTGFASDAIANVAYDLQDPNWPNAGNGTSPGDSNAVITSLDLERQSQLFAVSWAQDPTNTQSSFDVASHRVAPAALSEAASSEAALGRVITAVSYDAGDIFYLSYGWSAETGVVYEAQTVTANADDAAAAAASLASMGYILTAFGRADDAGDVVLVGTRVQGDTMPRPFTAATSEAGFAAQMSQGYSTVGVVIGAGAASLTYLGER